ncbi:MAG: DUF6034 family protein [Clostridia bacterium]|nr:DUF6034 family protein [Clostridia bacterium]
MRIRMPNDSKTYRMVPAWFFQGKEQLMLKGSDEPIDNPRNFDGLYPYLVINAVDGSIIDPSLGY